MLPVKDRAAVHFLIAYLQIVVGLVAASLVWGCPLPDLVVKFGGTKPGSVAPDKYEDGKTPLGMPRPANSTVKSDFYSHLVLGIINLALGVCALVLDAQDGF